MFFTNHCIFLPKFLHPSLNQGTVFLHQRPSKINTPSSFCLNVRWVYISHNPTKPNIFTMYSQLFATGSVVIYWLQNPTTVGGKESTPPLVFEKGFSGTCYSIYPIWSQQLISHSVDVRDMSFCVWALKLDKRNWRLRIGILFKQGGSWLDLLGAFTWR